MKKIDAVRFGETLKRYRKQQGLSQKDLRERLEGQLDNDAPRIRNKSTVSKWEHGVSVPNKDVVEALDYILCTDGTLLSAAGYLVQRKGVVQQGPPVSQVSQSKLDHFTRLTQTAGELLGGELDTVVRRKPDLLSEHPTASDVYRLRYLIGEDEKQREIRGSRITQMLMNNWYSAFDHSGASQVDSLVCHLMAELPGVPEYEPLNPHPGRPGFEYLAVNLPFWLINTLKGLLRGKEFKGTCEVCKELK